MKDKGKEEFLQLLRGQLHEGGCQAGAVPSQGKQADIGLWWENLGTKIGLYSPPALWSLARLPPIPGPNQYFLDTEQDEEGREWMCRGKKIFCMVLGKQESWCSPASEPGP